MSKKTIPVTISPVEVVETYLDAFARLRTSNPLSLFDSQHQYNLQPLFWSDATVGGATIVHLPNEATVRLRAGTASGDKATHQTKEYFRYQPGKSQQVVMTGIFGTGKTGVAQRLGYFDDNNGLFFQVSGTTLSVVRRSKATGSVVEETVTQSSWNLDKFDGSGSSGVTLDVTKTQVYLIDFEWLGSGRVRMGFFIDGLPVYCHQFLHANVLSTVYMTTPNLPLRYQVENTAAAASATDLKAICATVVSEGGFERARGVTHSANNGTTTISVSTRRAVLSIRPKLTFNSIENRGLVLPQVYRILDDGNVSIFYEIVLNATLGGVPSWVSVADNSLIEYDVAGTTVTGGEVLDAGYVGSAAQVSVGTVVEQILRDVPLALNQAGDTADILSIVCTSLGAGTAVAAALTVKEFY